MSFQNKAHNNQAHTLIGQRFGRLTVIAVSQSINRHSRVECVCDCGTERVLVMSRKLREGDKKSCGCMRRGVTITDEYLRRVNELSMRRMEESKAMREAARETAENERSTRAPGWGPNGREAARDLAAALGYTYRTQSGGQRKATKKHRLFDDAEDAVEMA